MSLSSGAGFMLMNSSPSPSFTIRETCASLWNFSRAPSSFVAEMNSVEVYELEVVQVIFVIEVEKAFNNYTCCARPKRL